MAFTDQGIVIGLRRRRRLLRRCDATTAARYDASRRLWRHLDFGACRVWLEADIRIDCRARGRVRTEQVPWARPNVRHTSDFENLVAWLAQRMDKTSIGRLLRCSCGAVDAIVSRVVVDHIDDSRLDHLYRIGVDEISYRHGHKFLTIVTDRDTGNVVWAGKQRSKPPSRRSAALGPRRAAAIEAISLDGSGVYLTVTREQIPQARICLGLPGGSTRHPRPPRNARAPGLATHPVRSARRPRTPRRAPPADTRTAAASPLPAVTHLELKEQLRDLYRSTNPAAARSYLRRRCTSARRSRIPAFANLVRRIEKQFDAIIAAVHLCLGGITRNLPAGW